MLRDARKTAKKSSADLLGTVPLIDRANPVAGDGMPAGTWIAVTRPSLPPSITVLVGPPAASAVAMSSETVQGSENGLPHNSRLIAGTYFEDTSATDSSGVSTPPWDVDNLESERESDTSGRVTPMDDSDYESP